MPINEWFNDGWMFEVTAMPGESLGHYLGRFRRVNCLSQSGLAELVLIDVQLLRGLEKPSLGQALSANQSKRLRSFLRLSETEFLEMMPLVRSRLHLGTRLCARCYGDSPIHRQEWQRAGVDQCDRHEARLLRACPACDSAFRLPALWESGCCEQCWLPFQEMYDPN